MELVRDFLLAAIAIILFIGLTPVGQKLVQNPSTTSEKTYLANIDTQTANIDSNTDPISDLLTQQKFVDEDFAQDSNVDELESTTSNIDSNTANIDTNTQNLQNQVDNIEKLIGKDGRSTDAFGEIIAKNTQNLLNLPAHNPINRERWRLNIDGTPKNLQYNSYQQYDKKPDYHALTPNQGETVTLESTESPPYVVHYELWYSWAGSVNRSLDSGDVVRIGAFNDDNGYFLKFNSTSGVDEAYLMVRRNGRETKAKRVSLKRNLTDFTRFELRSNWYNAGEQTWVQTTADADRSDVQQQDVLGHTAPNGTRSDGPETPQLPLRFQVTRGGSSTPVTLEAGSANVLVAGDVEIISRVKTDYFSDSVSQAGKWEPVAALRIGPNNSFIRGELTSVDLAETGSDTDYFVSAQQHDPGLVKTENGIRFNETDSQWSVPEVLTADNANIQFTTNISEAPNSSGVPVSSADDLGGFQVGWGSLYTSGNKGATSSTAQQGRKRPLYGSDVVVFWAKAEDENNPGVPADLTVEYVVEMDY